MKKMILFSIALVICGCSSVNPFIKKADALGPPINIPVSLIVNNGVVTNNTICDNYTCTSNPDLNHLVIRDTLKKSGLFSKVSLNDFSTETLINVRFNNKVGEDDYLHFPKILVMAATMFITPIKMHFKYEAQFDIVKSGRLIRKYTYEVSAQEWVHVLGTTAGDMSNYAAEYLTEMFITEASQDRSFL